MGPKPTGSLFLFRRILVLPRPVGGKGTAGSSSRGVGSGLCQAKHGVFSCFFEA